MRGPFARQRGAEHDSGESSAPPRRLLGPKIESEDRKGKEDRRRNVQRIKVHIAPEAGIGTEHQDRQPRGQIAEARRGKVEEDPQEQSRQQDLAEMKCVHRIEPAQLIAEDLLRHSGDGIADRKKLVGFVSV